MRGQPALEMKKLNKRIWITSELMRVLVLFFDLAEFGC